MNDVPIYLILMLLNIIVKTILANNVDYSFYITLFN